MTAASWPRADPAEERLLLVDATAGTVEAASFDALPRALSAGDLLVLNDAATLPASIAGSASGGPIELRLLAERDDGGWEALLLGGGDWRTRTEDRPAPPALGPGARLALAGGLGASVERVSALSPRLVSVRFDRAGDALVGAIYRVGRPVQYAHLRGPLALGQVQNRFAARPWAVEMPSAGRPLTWELLSRLRTGGVALASVTHAAGISSSGDPAIDAALPFPERFEIPAETVAAVRAARARGGRIVAVGTTVVRALEGGAERGGGRLAAGAGVTSLRIGAGFTPRVVDAVLTGIHDPGTTHHALLSAFAPPRLLDRALAVAEAEGFLEHEFGDAMLVLAARGERRRRRHVPEAGAVPA